MNMKLSEAGMTVTREGENGENVLLPGYTRSQVKVSSFIRGGPGTSEEIPNMDAQPVSDQILAEESLSTGGERAFVYCGRNTFQVTSPDVAEALRDERLLDAINERTLRAEVPRLSGQSVAFLVGGNTGIGKRTCDLLGVEPGKLVLDRFANSETRIEIHESVRDRQAFVIATLSDPVNEAFMETALLVQALKLADARRITVVLPYFAYGRADRKMDVRPPISARAVTDMLKAVGADQLVTVDLHATQIEGFFAGAFESLSGLSQMVPAVLTEEGRDLVVVSPDAGGSKRAEKFSRELEKQGGGFAPLVIMSKFRPGPGKPPEVTLTVGKEYLQGKTCVLVDDMLDTGGSILAAARALKERGAARVVVCATHPVFSRGAVDKLSGSRLNDGQPVIDRVFVTDTQPINVPRSDFLRVVSIAPLIAEVLARLDKPMATLRDLRESTDLGMLLPSGGKTIVTIN